MRLQQVEWFDRTESKYAVKSGVKNHFGWFFTLSELTLCKFSTTTVRAIYMKYTALDRGKIKQQYSAYAFAIRLLVKKL